MKAMILAAGLGTRLSPLTDQHPKALVSVGGMPLLEFAIRRLLHAGIEEILINIHHFGEQIIQFLEDHDRFGAHIVISDEREKLLDTGGALKKAASFFKEDGPFLLFNVDVISEINLEEMVRAHQREKALATLAVRKRNSSRYLLFNERQRLSGWRHVKKDIYRWCGDPNPAAIERAFSGIHIIEPAIFDFFPDKDVFSIIEVYLQACSQRPIIAFPHDQDRWMDAGKIADLESAGQLLQQIVQKEKLL